MNTYTEYYVVTAGSIEDLNQRVSQLLKQGWIPFGSLVASNVSVGTPAYMFAQPMVK